MASARCISGFHIQPLTICPCPSTLINSYLSTSQATRKLFLKRLAMETSLDAIHTDPRLGTLGYIGTDEVHIPPLFPENLSICDPYPHIRRL